MEVIVKKWFDYDIRFVKYCGQWWAVLQDVCDALNLHIFTTLRHIDANNIRELSIPSSQSTQVINERGVYHAILSIDYPNLHPFIDDFACDLYEQLRIEMRMQPYDVMFMIQPEIKRCIDNRLRYIFGPIQTVENKE